MRTTRANRADAHEDGAERKVKWGDVIKGLAAVHVANAAERVLQRRSQTPESGRKGGEVARRSPSPAVRVGREARNAQSDSTTEAPDERPVAAGVLPTAKLVFREFGKDNGTLMAASVAFYIMLSLVPLALVGIAILGHVLGDAQAQKQVMSFLKEFFPAQFDMLRGLVQQVHDQRGKIGLAGLAGFLLTASGGFVTLETAINITWGAPNRNFIMNKVFAFAMMLLIGTLLILSLGITTVVSWAGNIPALAWLEQSAVARVVGIALSVLISSAMFTFMYKFFPNVKSAWKPAMISGVLTAVLWELFKVGYTWYSAKQLGNQQATYGDAAGFIGLVLWIYYSSALVLLGAELTWVLNGCPRRKEKEQGTRTADATAA